MTSPNDLRNNQGICKYALNDIGELIFIDEVPLEYRERGVYYSYVDNSPMIARKGKKNKWHFAHKDSSLRAGESDIHKLGKLAFKQEFEKPGPFWVTINTPHHCRQVRNCKLANQFGTCNRVFPRDFNLKSAYIGCELEKEVLDGAFKADICLIPKDSSRDPMLIEIYHSNESSDAKKHSGLPIIEITIKQEEDVKLFSSRRLKESDSIVFNGMQPKRSFPTDGIFKRPVSLAKIDSDHVLTVEKSTCYDLSANEKWYHGDDLMAIALMDDSDYRKIARLAFQVAYRNGIRVRGCRLCSYYRGAGMCDISYRMATGASARNRALGCPHFELNENMVFPEHPGEHDQEYNSFFFWRKGKEAELISECLYHGEDFGITLMEEERASLQAGPHDAYFNYLTRVIDCYYQVTHDVPADLLSLYAEEAVRTGRFVVLKENTTRDTIIDGKIYMKVYAFVPALVNELPDSLVI